jgi:hypothetical protein
MGPDRGRTRLHHLFDPGRSVGGRSAGSQRPRTIRRSLTTTRVEPGALAARSLTNSSGRRGQRLTVGAVQGGMLRRVGPDGRQASRHPIDLPGRVVVDGAVPEPFEPPRGWRAHVSEPVPAIDDHGASGVEYPGRGGGLELLERQVNSTGKVLVVVLVPGAEPRPAEYRLLDEAAQRITVDDGRNGQDGASLDDRRMRR